MNAQEILIYCAGKAGSSVEFPFGDEPACVKLGGRIFAQVYPRGEDSMVTFKCLPAYGKALRAQYPEAISRGYHCPTVQQPYWNTVRFRDEITDDLWIEMADHAYNAVLSRLTRAAREAIAAEQDGHCT